jgi:hypothetical protein
MSDGGWSLIQAHFGKALKRLSVPGSRDGVQTIEIDFADGTQIRAKGPTLQDAWEVVWRYRYPKPEEAP